MLIELKGQKGNAIHTGKAETLTERERARTGYSYCKMTSEGCEELF